MKALAVILSAAIVSTGCASASAAAAGPQVVPALDSGTLADYAQRIPAGSRVRVERTSGEVMRGTLIKASSDRVVLQRNTRIPEAPVDVPFAGIARLTLDNGGGTSTAKAIGIGVASGVGAFFAILAILAASWND